MAKKNDEIIVGLDIGTTKVCAVVGEATESGVSIIGIGTAESTGLRKGIIVNIETTTHAIRKAVEEAELMAGCEISSVYVGVAGAHIKGFNSRGIVAVNDKREVRLPDLERVVDAAKAVQIPSDRDVIHILPQEYLVDDCDGVREPLGMCGTRLEAKVHIVTAARSATENIIRCTNGAGLHVIDVVLEPLASAATALYEDEKELGVTLVDIGGGTTDIAVFYNGSVVHTAVLPLGGNQVTNDIAVGMRTPRGEAERIKLRHGCAMISMVGDEESIEVPSVGGRDPSTARRQFLCEIIEPRIEELYRLIHQEIQRSGFEDLLASGVVITGGAALLDGMVELGEEVIGLPVRLGQPTKVGGLADVVRSPKFSTGVGLVLYGATHGAKSRARDAQKRAKDGGRMGRMTDRLRSWLGEIF